MVCRRSFGGMCGATVSGVILTWMILGCGPAPTPSGGSGAVATPAGNAAASDTAPPGSPTASPERTGPSPTVPGRDAPPDAFLAAEGGDPVVGQLGTYVWLGFGSDAPWLPGAPIRVGSGEPLTVSLVPEGDIRAWSARYVPANAAGPDGATSLGEGAGRPAFAAPGPGAWTAELFVEFAPAVGDARYFWRLEVE